MNAKRILLNSILALIFCLRLIGQNINYNDLVLGGNQLFYLPNDSIAPYTGLAITKDSIGRIINEINITHGRQIEHKTIEYYENGQRKNETVRKFEKNSEKITVISYYEDGVKESEGVLIGGTYHMTTWYNNGKMQSKFSMKNDKLIGERKGWYENGQQRYMKIYKSESNAEIKYWFLDGKLKGEISIVDEMIGDKNNWYDEQGKLISGWMTDQRDGKKYRTIKINKRTWMAENMRHYIKGSLVHNNDLKLLKKYGRLYKREQFDSICPKGWKIPSVDDWDELQGFIKTNGDTGDGSDIIIGGGSGFNLSNGSTYYFEDKKYVKGIALWGRDGNSTGSKYYGIQHQDCAECPAINVFYNNKKQEITIAYLNGAGVQYAAHNCRCVKE